MTLAVLKRHDLYIVVRDDGAASSNKKKKRKKKEKKKQRRGEAEGGGTVASFALHSHNDNVTIRRNYSASSCG